MATGGLYGSSLSGNLVAQPGTESVGLYGNSVPYGGTYFEWFIFQESVTQPATPTGGSWNFTTNVGTPPTGWTTIPPATPTNIVWACITFVNSKTGSTFTWSTPATWIKPGTPGTSGYSGYSGFSGYSGYGLSGFSGYSGYSGYSGSGVSGYSGYSGSGTSGYSGFSGTSGYSGAQGASGFSGISGYSGVSGFSGYSGFSGSGISGYSGYSGSGISGYSGYSGIGTSGYSGYSGISGYSGYSGTSGYSGSGISGYSGYSGYSGSANMIYPGSGIPFSIGSAWSTSYGTSGANSVVLRDANSNITINCVFEGYVTQAASGTTIVLLASSAQNYQITGSGGQIIRLPDATTLPNGATFTFNNNQTSGAITVQNNSSTTIATIQSGGYVTVVLLNNSTAAGVWDRHDSTPSNVSWSTNTLDYAGSITSATWNGNTVAINRGGTGLTSVGTSGYVLTSNGSTMLWAASTGGSAVGGAAYAWFISR
jgi:hypothetical protein